MSRPKSTAPQSDPGQRWSEPDPRQSHPNGQQAAHQPMPHAPSQHDYAGQYGAQHPHAAAYHQAPQHAPAPAYGHAALSEALAAATANGRYQEAPYAQQPSNQYAAPGTGQAHPAEYPTHAAYPSGQHPAGTDPYAYAGDPRHAAQFRAPEGWPQQRQDYDLNQYGSGPAQAPPGAYAPRGHHASSPADLQYAPEPQAHENFYGRLGQPAFDSSGMPINAPLPATYQEHYPADPSAHEAAGAMTGERTSGRRRGLIVATALVSAIGVGMGLAYGYKQLTAGKTASRPPVVEAPSTAAKAAPDRPGGKLFPNADKQFTQRLGDAGTAGLSGASAVPPVVPTPSADTDATGMRRVSTMTIGRDGTITASPPQPAPAPTSGVPGLILDSVGPPPSTAIAPPPPPVPPATRPPPAAVRPPPPVAAAPAPPPPKLIARAEPAPPPPAPAASAPPEPAAKKPILRGTTPPPTAAAPAPSVGAAATTASKSSGYVAVLASRRTHKDAMEAFVDLQSKYGAVLSGGTPEVREISLGDKGVWYRLLYGPSRSLDATREVCTQLKSQGFVGDCWAVKR